MNNPTNFIRSALIILTLLAGMAGCSGENSSPGTSSTDNIPGKIKPETLEIVDGHGEIVSIKKPVERIIVEYMDNAELVRILDRQDRVVGISGYDYIFDKCLRQFPEIRKKPSVGIAWNLDYEAVLGLRPDILLLFGTGIDEKREKLPSVDVLFLGLYYPDLINPEKSRFIRGVRNLGRILDAEERSEKYIEWYLDLIHKISSRTDKIPASQKPEVFITSYPHADLNASTLSAHSRKVTLTQASSIAGGNNICESLPEFNQDGTGVKVDLEWVIAKDPEIIIMHAVDRVDLYGYETDDPSGIAEAMDYFMSRPEIKGLKAVKNKQVYLFDGHFRNDASGGILAAAYMAKIFHPELFADINPEAVHQEYLDMQGLDYDLNEHGIFIYPPLIDNNNIMGIPDACIKGPSDGID